MRIEKIEQIKDIIDIEDDIVNLYKVEGNIYILYGDDKVVSIYDNKRIDFKQYAGFEMELGVGYEICTDNYHSGNRGSFNGIVDGCFSAIESDSSLGNYGAEFITYRHEIANKLFFIKLESELDFINEYTDGYNDLCGGHIHHSTNIEKDIYKWLSPFRAFIPMLIEIFGNGEYGIRRENDYFGMGIKYMVNEHREGIYYKGNMHVEHRYFDSENIASRWYSREVFLKWLGIMGMNTRRIGIFRYISPEAWAKGYINVDENRFVYTEHKVIEIRDFLREVNKMMRIYGGDMYERYVIFKVLSGYMRDKVWTENMYSIFDEENIKEEMGNNFVRKRSIDMEYVEVI